MSDEPGMSISDSDSWICQVGRAMVAKLQERGLENCSDVQALEQQP